MILTLNVGSSSLKYALYDEHLNCTKEGEAKSFSELKLAPFSIVGHRVVHGGEEFFKPTRITDEVIAKLKKLIPFAPLHLPKEIALIEEIEKKKIPQVALFDTAFHASIPPLHRTFALPLSFFKDGIKRYGFHGISYASILDTLGDAAKNKKLIIAHLGSGASLVAIDNLQPIDTTMGFTPCGGIIMATRSGDLDPSILTYLLREKKYDANRLDDLLNHQSGLLGLSEESGDVKTLLDSTSPKAKEALELFCYQITKQIGAYAAALGKVDLLIFTGAIGENSEVIREKICKHLPYKTAVVKTKENYMIAKGALPFLQEELHGRKKSL